MTAPDPPENLPRVLLVIAQLATGGAEVQLVRLATRMKRRGLGVEVACWHPGGELEPLLESEGVRVHRMRRFNRVGLETILDLRRLLKTGRFDVVHSFLWPANWRARIAGVVSGTPVIVSSTRSVETWLTGIHVVVDRILARWTDAIIVNAGAIRDFLVERERIPSSKFRLIYNGLDEDWFGDGVDAAASREALGLSPGEPVVLIVGNFQPEKNHEDFLRMASLVHDNHPLARFVLVGDGERRAALKELAAETGLGDRVVWAGRQVDVRPWLGASDIVVNVSRREGCCNAILEGMAAGRPVLAYSVGGNPELVEDGVTGRLFEFGDTTGLAEAVSTYLSEPTLARRHGARGRSVLRARFSTGAMVDRTIDLYSELLAAKRGLDGEHAWKH